MHPEWDPTPEFVMSDFSPAISKAIKAIFSNTTQLKCRFHFFNAVLPKLKSRTYFDSKVGKLQAKDIPIRFRTYFQLKAKRKQNKWDPRRVFRYDICILSKLSTKELFDKYFSIVTPFWQHFSLKFFKYFKTNYIDCEENLGWTNFLSRTKPKTNNQVEGFNRAIKEFVTDRKIQKFGVYFQAIQQEIEFRSKSSLISFPKTPFIHENFLCYASEMSLNFENFYVSFNEAYYIKDKSVGMSFLSPNKQNICNKLKIDASKVLQKDEQTIKEFLTLFRKPSIAEIRQYRNPSTLLKLSCINTAKIRRLTLKMPINETYPTLSCSCSYPDYCQVSFFCLHGLGLLMKMGFLKLTQFGKNGQRGRKPGIPHAWEADENESEEEG